MRARCSIGSVRSSASSASSLRSPAPRRPTVIRDEDGAQAELTKVLPTAITGPMAAIDDVDNAARLRAATKRRARKGGWLFAIVIVLAALAAGIGWWFGSGPGSQIPVPEVANMTFEQAQGVLSAEGLVAVQEDVFDFDVPAGTTTGSDPDAGRASTKPRP